MSIRSKAHALAKRLKHKLSLRSNRGHNSRMTRRHGAICEPLESRMLLSTVTVTGTADLIDGDTSSIAALIATPGNDGEITLREAVQAANNTVGEDVIEFDQALAGEMITLSSALNVLDSLSIVGLGEDQLTLTALGFSDVFLVNLDSTNSDNLFSLSNITFISDIDNFISAVGNVELGQLNLQHIINTGNFSVHCTTLRTNSQVRVENAGFNIEALGDVVLESMWIEDSLSVITETGLIIVGGDIICNSGNISLITNLNKTISGDFSLSAINSQGNQDSAEATGYTSISIDSIDTGFTIGMIDHFMIMDTISYGGTITGGSASLDKNGDGTLHLGGDSVTESSGNWQANSDPLYLPEGHTITSRIFGDLYLTDTSLITILESGSIEPIYQDGCWQIVIDEEATLVLEGDFLLGPVGSQQQLIASGGKWVAMDGSTLIIKSDQYILHDGDQLRQRENMTPTANDMTLTAMEDGDSVTLAFDASDPDSGDSLTYQLLSNLPYGQLINNGNGTFSYTAGDWQQLNDGMQRDITFTYRVIDNHGAASEPATVTITIQGKTETQGGNDAAPIGVPNFTRTDSQTAIDINVLANDYTPDGDLLITSHVDAVSELGVALTVNADGTIAYDPTEALADLEVGQRVRDVFTYTVADPFGNSDIVRVFVDVTGAQTPVVNVASQPSHQRSTLAMRQPVLVHDQAEFVPWSLPRTPPVSLSLQSLLQGGSDDENTNRLHLLLVDEVSIDAEV